MIQSGITKGTPTKILFGATQEGGTLTITPEFFAPELDGALVAIRELQRKIGETAIMEVSFAELEARHMKKWRVK